MLAPGCLAHPFRLSRGQAVLVGWDISPLPEMGNKGQAWEPFEYGCQGEPLHRAEGTWRLG